LETKLFPWDGSVCVPFLLNWAKHPEWAGQVSDLPIDSPDIMPTLLGLLGLPIPDSVEGRDWSPILRGEAEATGDEDALLIMAAEFTELRFNGMRAYRGLRNRQYTYVRNLEGPWLLYDNQADPYQKQNLIANPEHAAIRKRLDAKLQARLDDMGDAFEDGLTLCERAGYSHYKELHLDCRK
jgi:arylsulfatase A-like enzyme